MSGIKRHQYVLNDEVWRLTGQPKLIAIVQTCCLTLFGHIACMDDNGGANRILSTLSRGLEETTRMPPHHMAEQDLRSHNVTLPEEMDMVQNWSLWRMWSTYGATLS